jgi:hypothetical protein
VASAVVQTVGGVGLARGYDRLALNPAESWAARAVEARATIGSSVFCVCAIQGPVETRRVCARQTVGTVVANHRRDLAAQSGPTR